MKKVSIFGERNTGTNWLKKLIEDSYPGTEVSIEDKHLYHYKADEKERYLKTYNLNDPTRVKIFLYKNPWSWIASMRKMPYHAWDLIRFSNGQSTLMDMSEFIKSKFVEYPGDYPGNRNFVLASFENVIDLRNKKNGAMKELFDSTKNSYIVDYEELLLSTKDILLSIFKLVPKTLPEINEAMKGNEFNKERFGEERINYYKLKEYIDEYSEEEFEFVINNLDKGLERWMKSNRTLPEQGSKDSPTIKYLKKHAEQWEYPCEKVESPSFINYMWDWRELAIEENPNSPKTQKSTAENYAIYPKFLVNCAKKVGFNKKIDFSFMGSFRRHLNESEEYTKRALETRAWIFDLMRNFTDKSFFKRVGHSDGWKNKGDPWDYTDLKPSMDNKFGQKITELGFSNALAKELYEKMDNYAEKNLERLGYEFPGMDLPYLLVMCSTKFALCPAGDMPWSMRFYESLMCKAIPVVKKESETFRTVQESNLDYKYYLHNAPDMIYREDWAEHNYKLFIQYHTLIDN